VFTKELENGLLAREIDFAVHSLKDLPVELPDGLMIAAYITRERPNDVLISKEHKTLRDIPRNGVVATGSLRRKLQLLAYRHDLQIVDVRGNIDTRLEKLYNNDWDGLILAYAGLKRLGRTEVISEILPEDLLYPAVGQGIVAVECRADRYFQDLFATINDPHTETCALAERAFLEALGGGCQVPVGVISKIQNSTLSLSGIYMPEDGKYVIKDSIERDAHHPAKGGKILAEKILTAYHQEKSGSSG
jgi:hydroxymethylbilane synthase